jgi:hypothetical protein
MLGFLIGTVCLIGLFKVVRHGRHYGHGYGHGGGPWRSYAGGCGHHGHGPYGWGGRGGWDDEEDFAPWERRGGGSFGLRAIFGRLDTTPGQEKAIKAAFDELRAKARAVKDDARGMRGDLATALRGESLDAETLGTVASRASGAVDALRDAAIGAVLKVHDVLDERQRGIAADFLESGPRFGRGWRGRGGPYRSGERV